MNKELTPLEALQSFLGTRGWYDDEFKQRYDFVVKTLKDYQLYEEILNEYEFNLADFREACFLLKQFRESGFTGIEKKLKDYEKLEKAYDILRESYEEVISGKPLKALEIISNISKKTSHFKLKQRQNFGEDKMSYYLVIGQGIYECEYALRNKEEYDLLEEVLL